MSYELTKNFEKELFKFFDWVGDYYIVENDLTDIMEWNKDLLSEFEETPRKKLDGFLKHVFKIYIIKNKETNEVIDSYIEMVSQFKNQKETEKETDKETNKETNKEQTIKRTRSKKQTSKIKNNDDNSDTESNTNDDLSNYQFDLSDLNNDEEEDVFDITIDNQLSTTRTWWLDNLIYKTEHLIKALGEPSLTGSDNDKHRYEWKFKYKKSTYTIYDWRFQDEDFNDLNECEWFLGGNNDNDMYIDEIINILDSKISM
jgi:hypothetical protein